jgi:Flp pilus assembly protein TadD
LVNSYINLANLYLYTLNQKDLAIKTYQDALRNLPGNQDLEVLLGIAYEHAGDKAKARSTYQQVLGQNANNAAAQAGLKRVQ